MAFISRPKPLCAPSITVAMITIERDSILRKDQRKRDLLQVMMQACEREETPTLERKGPKVGYQTRKKVKVARKRTRKKVKIARQRTRIKASSLTDGATPRQQSITSPERGRTKRRGKEKTRNPVSDITQAQGPGSTPDDESTTSVQTGVP
jgi:hypothetical protein